MGIEVIKQDVDVYAIVEDGYICIEKGQEHFILECEDLIIDLNQPYQITDLVVSQGETKVTLETTYQMDYFKSILKLLGESNEPKPARNESPPRGQLTTD